MARAWLGPLLSAAPGWRGAPGSRGPSGPGAQAGPRGGPPACQPRAPPTPGRPKGPQSGCAASGPPRRRTRPGWGLGWGWGWGGARKPRRRGRRAARRVPGGPGTVARPLGVGSGVYSRVSPFEWGASHPACGWGLRGRRAWGRAASGGVRWGRRSPADAQAGGRRAPWHKRLHFGGCCLVFNNMHDCDCSFWCFLVRADRRAGTDIQFGALKCLLCQLINYEQHP